MPTFKLSWKPDSTQPLPAGQSAYNDPTFADHLGKVQTAGAAVQGAVVEVNGVLDLRQWCPPVDDQGQLEDCVADSTTGGLEFIEIRDGKPFVKKSRLFLYYNARLQTQDTDKDEGTYIRLAFATLTSLGTCTEATWPYDGNNVFIRPSWRSYQEAFPHKITSFYSIQAAGQDLIDQIKQALQAQHPVVFGMTVDNDYMSYTGGIMPMPRPTRTGAGGHAQLIVGYDNNTQTWLVKNSWGTGWGESGYAHVPWAYLEVSKASDFWVPFIPNANQDVTTVTVTPSA